MNNSTLRCTECTWRGTQDEAALARPVRPSDIPPSSQATQSIYAEARKEAPVKLPPCPTCGHHLTKATARRASIRPHL